jgi:ubiquinol-cytochrome c reductase subunit 6
MSNNEKAGVEDPKPALKEECAASHHCHSLNETLHKCSQKVEAGEGDKGETCVEEFFDLMTCVDHCVAPKLFAKLV